MKRFATVSAVVLLLFVVAVPAQAVGPTTGGFGYLCAVFNNDYTVRDAALLTFVTAPSGGSLGECTARWMSQSWAARDLTWALADLGDGGGMIDIFEDAFGEVDPLWDINAYYGAEGFPPLVTKDMFLGTAYEWILVGEDWLPTGDALFTLGVDYPD